MVTQAVTVKPNNAAQIDLGANFQIIDFLDVGPMPDSEDIFAAMVTQNCEVSVCLVNEKPTVVLKTELVEDREILFPLTPSQYSKLVQV